MLVSPHFLFRIERDPPTTDAAKVAATLRANTFKTIVGDLAFDAKGDIKKPEYAFYAWKGGKYAQVP